jgi:hypothetical protein
MKPILRLSLFLKFCIFSTVLAVLGTNASLAADRYYYEMRVYHLKTQAQEDRLDNYFERALLPALHRMGINDVGVFKPLAGDTTGRKMYLLR